MKVTLKANEDGTLTVIQAQFHRASSSSLVNWTRVAPTQLYGQFESEGSSSERIRQNWRLMSSLDNGFGYHADHPDSFSSEKLLDR